MKKMIYFKNLLYLILCISIRISFAQDANAFLDREYWKTNPDIADVEQKITDGNDISELNRHFFDAVSYALIEKVDNETIKHLLTKKGNDVNKLTHDGRTYIFWAAYRGNIKMMQFLVDNGAKTNIIDSHGYSLLNFAAVTGQLSTALYDFCIAQGADVSNEKNNDGANALLLVAPFITDYKLVDYFTSKGIDIHSTDDDGNGIFNYAAKRGNVLLMDALIKKKVSYDGTNANDENAMIFASEGTRGYSNSVEIFQYLEKLGIEPNVTTKKGNTPLHSLAYKSKDTIVLAYFLSKGVDINQQDDTGRSALINAIQWGNVKVTQFLVDKGANIFVKDSKGNNLAYYLMKQYNTQKPEEFDQKLAIFSKKGFDILQQQENGNTLFHLALDYHNTEVLEKVKTFGIDVNTKNKDGITPLHKAAMIAKNDAVLKYLLTIGADKAIKTDFEESVYDLASENELLQKQEVVLNFLK
ncbi:ankyrin repeat domain-containing protein [Aquimarina addita]|uniref:Ankyrin repeat domain-containing protein n=1 Tax=Aquimarina addita TaxID=870485 RepID=A0ABP6UQP2_9FLAO